MVLSYPPLQVPDSPAAIRMENEFRYEATGQRYVTNEEGLTLASYINNPRQLLSKAVGLLDLDSEGVPQPPQEGDGGVPMDTDDVGVAGGKNQGTYSEIPLIWTPEMWPPLYSGHFEKSPFINTGSSLK